MSLQRFSHRLARSTRARVLLALGMAQVVLMLLLNVTVNLAPVGPLDLRMHYSGATAVHAVGCLTDAQRRTYALSEVTLDVAYPLAYSLFLALALTKLLTRLFAPEHRAQCLNLVPLAAGVVDLLENSAIVSLLLSYPRHPGLLPALAGLLTLAKWVLVAASVLLLLGLILRLFLQRLPRDPAVASRAAT